MKQTNKALKAKIKDLENQLARKEDSKKYNGWTNYETWAVNLWMDNDEGSADNTREQAEEIYRESTQDSFRTRLQVAAYSLMESLRDEFRNQTPDLEGCYMDLLNGACSEVNFHEIAMNIMEEVAAEVDKEEAEELEGANA